MPDIAGMDVVADVRGFLHPNVIPDSGRAGLAARRHRCDALAMPTDTGFPYVARADARVLILGSMPGTASLAATQYYAHPRNAFWPIMAELLGFDAALPYVQRLQRLRESGVALWDVVHRCRRPGSLDANIEKDSVEANDFPAFFAGHARIRAVYFNGGTAASLYRRHVLPILDANWRDIPRHTLPSTSPAHAARSFADKLACWQAAMHPAHRIV